MTLEKMLQGYSNCRNKALAEAFVYMNMIENRGSGIRRVRAEPTLPIYAPAMSGEIAGSVVGWAIERSEKVKLKKA